MIKITVTSILMFLYLHLSAQNPVDVIHYKFSIELNDRNDTIQGEAEIIFLTQKNNPTISFDLTQLQSGKGMVVTDVFKGGPTPKKISFTHQSDKINFRNESLPGNNDTNSVIIRYKGIPSDGLIIAKNKYGHRTFFADNWPDRAHDWIPCNDHPSDKASVEFIVTAPAHYQVVSNGIQIEETNLSAEQKLTHWKEEIALPTKVMVIGVADFAVSHAGEVNCVPVSSWVYPENKTAGFFDYAPAKDILSFYIDYIGPYPYKKLANVQSNTIFGGMENAGAIFYFENSVTGTRSQEPLFAHEIVHQWFGDMATEKSFPHLWLSEGFATYLTNVYLQSKYGFVTFRDRMIADRKLVVEFVKEEQKPVVDSASQLFDLLNANSYQKGSWVLHMLRHLSGDSVFHQIIRTYYDRYKGKNADTHDFQKIAEELTKKDLFTFFRQWLYTPVNPDLEITWRYDKAKKTVTIVVDQRQAVLFEFPLEFQLLFPNVMPRTQVMDISKKQQTFIFPADAKPSGILFDPNVVLLYSGDTREK